MTIDVERPAGWTRWRYLLFGLRVPYRYRDWVERDLATRRAQWRWVAIGSLAYLSMLLVVAVISGRFFWQYSGTALVGLAVSYSPDRVRTHQVRGWRKEGFDVALPQPRRPRVVVPTDGRDGMQRFYNRSV